MEKKRQTGKWISAPKQWLKSLENLPEKKSEKGKWIWPKAYVRGHIRREFTLNELPIEARLEFWCDNKIDVYINGKAVIEGEKRVVSTEQAPVIKAIVIVIIVVIQAPAIQSYMKNRKARKAGATGGEAVAK